MNWAASHLESRKIFHGLVKMEGFYRKEGGTRKLSARKNNRLLEESKRSGEAGFSLAELYCFHWLGLLLGEKKRFSPPAKVVK